MLELVQRVNWDEYLSILLQGDPPIGFQLLAANAMLMAFWLFRRTRKGKSRYSWAWLLPMLFIAGNIGIVALGGRLSL
jgi:hypothetical protein